MARKATFGDLPTSAELSIDAMKRAVARLRRRIQEVEAFDPQVSSREDASQKTRVLSAAIEESLVQIFGNGTIEYNRYRPASFFDWPINMLHETALNEIQNSLREDKQKSIDLLQTAVAALEERIEEAPYAASNPESVPNNLSTNRQIFIVHGHDEAARLSVARFLEKIHFLPIILSEQPNQGQTIIEKFELNANVGFAVVLLTPDDEGAAVGKNPQPRARQNVILELGYFIGKLGRSRVCALKHADIEIPSDILGVVWTNYDLGGAWKTDLAKELQAAGYQIDWNRVMN